MGISGGMRGSYWGFYSEGNFEGINRSVCCMVI